MDPACAHWVKHFLLDLLYLTLILLLTPNIFLKWNASLILIFDTFYLIYLDSLNLFVNDFFFFLFGSWWKFWSSFLFLFSICCDPNNKFPSVFTEPVNIALTSSSFSLTVCNSSTLPSTRNVRFRTFNSSLQIGPIDLESFFSLVVSPTHFLFQRVLQCHSHWQFHGFLYLS